MTGRRIISKRLFTRNQRLLACDLLEKPIIPFTRSLKARMSELRDVIAGRGIVIHTVRGVGYSLADESRDRLKELLT